MKRFHSCCHAPDAGFRICGFVGVEGWSLAVMSPLNGDTLLVTLLPTYWRSDPSIGPKSVWSSLHKLSRWGLLWELAIR